MGRHVTYLRLKTLQSGEDRIIEGWASTPREDRVGDVVVPDGARYDLPLPLLFAHKHDEPIGSVISATVTRAGIRIRAKLTEGVARAEEVWRLVKDGALTAVSIGFQPLRSTPLEGGGLRFDEWSWHELSIVSVPANPDAKIAIGKGVAYATNPGPVRVMPRTETVAMRITPKMAEAKAHELGGDQWAAMEAGAVAARDLLPPEVRGLVDPERSGRCPVTRDYTLSDREGRTVATVKATGEIVRTGEPPKSQTQGLTPAQRAEVRRVVERSLDDVVKGIGKAIGTVVRDTDKKLAQAIVKVADKVDHLEASVLHDAGFYQDGRAYKRGAVVVHNRSTWLATKDTNTEPGRMAEGWREIGRKAS